MSDLRVAFAHDWLVTFRGGEKVLEALMELYPDAPVHTLFYDPKRMPRTITSRNVRAPFLLNGLRPLRKALLPVLPYFAESLDFGDAELIVSTSSCVVKGVKPPQGAKHLCYIHSPMRYIWDQQDEYLRGVQHLPGAVAAIKALTPRLRRWDVESAARVDHFVANSRFVAERVRNYYGREATVVHPPIATEKFRPGPPLGERRGYFLAAGAFVSYKRFDLAIKAAEALGKELIVAGSGPLEGALRELAGPKTRFEIAPDDARFAELLAGADGLLFPGVEDFGMIAVEAMASGTPVLALERGGALDFVVPGKTGAFFPEPEVDALVEAMRSFDRESFKVEDLVEHAAKFGRAAFLDKMRSEIERVLRGEVG